MKQYALLSLPLLLSIPVLGQEGPKSPRTIAAEWQQLALAYPAPADDSTETTKTPKALFGVHTLEDKGVTHTCALLSVPKPAAAQNNLSELAQRLDLVEVLVIKVSEKSILEEVKRRSAYHDAQAPQLAPQAIQDLATYESTIIQEEAKKLEARAASLQEAVEAGRLREAAGDLEKAAATHFQEICEQSQKEARELGEQLDAKAPLQKFAPEPADQKRMEAHLTRLNNLPEENNNDKRERTPVASLWEKETEAITEWNNRLDELKALDEPKGYESDTEKGLKKEKIEIYRFNKYLKSAKQVLLDAHPILMAWLKDPENPTQSLEKLSVFASQLDTHIDRIEIWEDQIGSFNCKKLTGFYALKTTLSAMKEGFDASATDENRTITTKFEHNISHPAMNFLMTTERLEKLLEK